LLNKNSCVFKYIKNTKNHILFTYCDNIERPTMSLVGDEAHHLTRVLRAAIGDNVKLFDGKGITATGTISKVAKNKVEIAVSSVETHKPKENGRIIICASLAKGERYDWLVSKCTELGVDRICPLIFERTVKLASGHSIERYNKIALAAAKQCERLFLPQIDAPSTLTECLRRLSKEYPNAHLLFGSTTEKTGTIFAQDYHLQDVIAFVGPEGGMTEKEGGILRSNGAVGVGITETVLRIETAAVAFAAILCTLANCRDSKGS
jgi:16S rRNA (uracil1498-N3)-methyltransferase